MEEDAVRASAIKWLQQRSLDGTVPISREALANDFYFEGNRFPLIDRGRGIRKPLGWPTALSILTAFPKGARGRMKTQREQTAHTDISSGAIN